MFAPDQAVTELALPPLDIRALARRAALPALVVAAAAGAVLLGGGQIHALGGVLRRALHTDPVWAAVALVFECISIAGYVALMSLVAGRATPRVGMRESAEITLTGAGATRLLPTAGAGGAAVTIWALRRAGLGASAAARTLLTFFVLLYAVFLSCTAAFGVALTFGGHGPAPLSAAAGAAATLAIVACLVLGSRGGTGRATRLVGLAVRDAVKLLRSRDLRLVGAAVYWAFDAAVLWAMLSAFGSPPPLPVLGLAYFLGQVANTLPIPGSVSGGMTGILIAWGVPVEIALPSVLAYRTVAVWLPTPAALAAIPALRATVARWSEETVTGRAGASAPPPRGAEARSARATHTASRAAAVA